MDIAFHVPIWAIAALFLVLGIVCLVWSLNAGSGGSSMGPFISFAPGPLVLAIVFLMFFVFSLLRIAP